MADVCKQQRDRIVFDNNLKYLQWLITVVCQNVLQPQAQLRGYLFIPFQVIFSCEKGGYIVLKETQGRHLGIRNHL
jgi:hypothetical protein